MKMKRLLAMALAAALLVTGVPARAENVKDITGLCDSEFIAGIEADKNTKNITNENLPVSVDELQEIQGSYLADMYSSVLLESSVEKKDGITYQWKMHEQDYEREFEDYVQKVTDIDLKVNGSSYTINSLDHNAVYTCTAYDKEGSILKTDVFQIRVNTGLCESLESSLKDTIFANKGTKVDLAPVFVKPEDNRWGVDYEAPYVLDGENVKLTYQWYVCEKPQRGIYYSCYRDEMKIIEDADKEKHTTEPVNNYTQYAVKVSDNFGNSATQYFDISVASGLTLKAPEDGNILTMKVEGQELVLKSHATANLGEKLTYEWTCRGCDNYDIDLPWMGEFTDTWVISAYDKYHGMDQKRIESYMEYNCRVKDEYGYYVDEGFMVYPDSGLSINGLSEENVKVVKCNQKLSVTAETEYGPLSYEWYWFSNYNEDEEKENYTELKCDKASADIDKEGYYRCIVRDQYNSREKTFCVKKDENAADYHSYGDWETKRPATVQSEGEEIRICKDCGHIDSRVVEKVKAEETKKDNQSDTGVKTPTVVKAEKAKIASVKNKKAKQAIVTIANMEGAAGYEVTYADNRKFKKAKTKVVKKNVYTIKRLKKGKTYFIKVRAYKLDASGKKIFGDYSAVKKVKIKK
ncbi:MAG: hypothetical protein E7294_02895 [Lachnospiraceae bacterium]|nr:hypothetical protein [Lachnospiraceae bacterium]